MKQERLIQLSLFDDYDREPTNKEICMMCHFSSLCGNCCKMCKDQCNSKQHCQIGVGEQADRLSAWMAIVLNNEYYAHMRTFFNDPAVTP